MAGSLVVGYDGTDGARAALTEALTLAADLSTTIVLVFSYSAPRIGGEVADLDASVHERGQAVLDEGLALAAAAGIEASTELLDKPTSAGLVAAADAIDARMIIVGSYGARPLAGALLGSTPHRLLHLSERPVLVVRTP